MPKMRKRQRLEKQSVRSRKKDRKKKKILQIKNNKTGFIRRKITWQEVYN